MSLDLQLACEIIGMDKSLPDTLILIYTAVDRPWNRKETGDSPSSCLVHVEEAGIWNRKVRTSSVRRWSCHYVSPCRILHVLVKVLCSELSGVMIAWQTTNDDEVFWSEVYARQRGNFFDVTLKMKDKGTLRVTRFAGVLEHHLAGRSLLNTAFKLYYSCHSSPIQSRHRLS